MCDTFKARLSRPSRRGMPAQARTLARLSPDETYGARGCSECSKRCTHRMRWLMQGPGQKGLARGHDDPSEAEEVWRLRTGHFNLQHRLTKSTRITSIIFARESDRATSSTDAGFAAFKTDGGVARPWRPLARRTELPAGRPRSGGPRARRSQSTAAPRPPPPQLFETIDHFGFVLPNSESSTESTAYPGLRTSRRPPERGRQQLVELRRTAIRLRHGGLNPLPRVQVLSRRPPRYLLHDQTPRSADALKAPVGRQRACCSLTRWLPARRGPRRPPRRSAARQSGEATPAHSSVRVR